MIVLYIENEIDFKYQLPFLGEVGKTLPQDIMIFYRKIPGLILLSDFMSWNKDANDLSTFKNLISNKMIKTIPQLLKLMNETKSLLITSYNFKKRGVSSYTNISVLNLGHSISGNTKYNLNVWVADNNEKSTAIVPSFFKKLKRFKGTRKKTANKRVHVDTYYKLFYLLRETPFLHKEVENKTILFLPHWTTTLSNLKRMIMSVEIPEGYQLVVKLHPASIYEENIFLNRTVKEAPNALADNLKKSENKSKYLEERKSIESLPNVKVFDDDSLELVDAIDQSQYLIFDGCSNTLVESIFRSVYFKTQHKIALLDTKITNRSYDLPDLFGYQKKQSIKIDDFVSPDREYILSLIDLERSDFRHHIIDVYSHEINAVINDHNDSN